MCTRPKSQSHPNYTEIDFYNQFNQDRLVGFGKMPDT